MRKIDIVFLIEHKDREMDSVVQIAQFLKKKFAMNSMIVSVDLHIYKLLFIKPKVVVFPYIIDSNLFPYNFVIKLFGNSVKYLNLNWEQLLSPINLEFKKPKTNFNRNTLFHIAWDNSFKSFLLENKVREDNIFITGNPTHDILKDLLLSKNEIKKGLSEQFNLNMDRIWIFLPMNYGWAFTSDDLIKVKISRGYDQEIAWEHQSYSRKCLNQFIYFVKELADNFDAEFIIRPHPGVSEKSYLKYFENENPKKENIHIIKDYTIKEWIVSSQIIGSSWSTSVWDAHKIGKTVFLFTPYPRPKWLDVEWNSMVTNIKDIQGFKKMMNSMTVNESNKDIVINAIENIGEKIFEISQISNPRKKFSFYCLIVSSIHFMRFLLCRYGKCFHVKRINHSDFFYSIKV